MIRQLQQLKQRFAAPFATLLRRKNEGGDSRLNGDSSLSISFGVAALFHLAVVIWLANFLLAQQTEIVPPTTAIFLSEPLQPKIDRLPIESLTPRPITPQANNGGKSYSTIVSRKPLPFTPVDLSTLAPETIHSAQNSLEFFLPSSGIPNLSHGVGTGTGDGAGDGTGSRKNGDSFFYKPEPNKSYIYVLDCSSSMYCPHPSRWKTRFRLLLAEMTRSVNALGPGNRFFIIFFNKEPVTMPAKGLQRATPALQKRFLYWASLQEPSFGTKPVTSLEDALERKPDVIHFLTDGIFEPRFQKSLLKIRQKRTVINTYALGNPRSELILRSIAASNGGRYRFIP